MSFSGHVEAVEKERCDDAVSVKADRPTLILFISLITYFSHSHQVLVVNHTNRYHSVLISKGGSSATLLKRAFPPIMFSKVIEMESFVMGPSWAVKRFLLPGFRMTTLSLFSKLKMRAHCFSTEVFSHMNLYLVPLSILRSYLAFKN